MLEPSPFQARLCAAWQRGASKHPERPMRLMDAARPTQTEGRGLERENHRGPAPSPTAGPFSSSMLHW